MQSLQCRVAESTMQIGTVDSKGLQRLQPGVTEPTYSAEWQRLPCRVAEYRSQSTDRRVAESSYRTELTELSYYSAESLQCREGKYAVQNGNV